MIIAENDYGWIAFESNELTIGSKVGDPPKVRLTSPVNADGGGGGVISFNNSRREGVVVSGQEQDEVAMIRVEQAEDVRGDTGNRKAELSFMLADGSGVGDVVKPLAFVWNAVTRILPDFSAALHSAIGIQGGIVTPPPTARAGDYDGAQFLGSKGKFLYARQGDGHDVLYKLVSGQQVPIWTSDGGDNGSWLNP